jgi:predicted enzyme related to lactoylglutathione lyase
MKPSVGTIAWCDLTVPDADKVRDFYRDVVGWTADPVEMGGYSDYCMLPTGADAPVAGVCHARGVSADLPPVWLLYVIVADLAHSVARVESGGGTVLRPPAPLTGGSFAVIRDPAGAVLALYQPPAGS